MKRTPEQILADKKRTNLTELLNRISSAISFKQVKTWRDVYKMEGRVESDYGANADSPIIYPAFKEYAAKLKEELESRLSQQSKPIEPLTSSTPVLDLTIHEPAQPTELVDKLPGVQPVKEQQEPEEELSSTNDYGLVPSDKEKGYYYWFQKRSIVEILTAMTKKNVRGQLLIGGTGVGKTYVMAGILRRLIDMKFADNLTFGPVPYLVVSKSTIIEKTRRDFTTKGITIKDGVEVINIEGLRSRAGMLWVHEKTVVVDGKEQIDWKWRPIINPAVIIWDECQGLKNEGSIQHQIGCSVNGIKTPVYQVFVSATPFCRVSEAKCFAISTHKVISDIIGLSHQTLLNQDTWPTYSCAIAAPSLPTEYNEAAVERLIKDLEPYIVRIRSGRWQFNPINRIEKIGFETKEEKDYYDDTERRYLSKLAKLDADKAAGKVMNDWILRMIIVKQKCIAAEFCRKKQIGKRMFNAVKEGYAAVAAVGYKKTLIGIVRYLVEECGVPRDQISLIWGGGKKQLTSKEKTKADIRSKTAALEASGLDINELFEDLEIEDTEDVVEEVIPEHLRLGTQSREERQREIDKFQSGRTLYCIYTFKAGGVGLSLHHSDEMTKYKCKRKASGYAVEEDIPNVPVRPRINFVAPTYSAIELVQGLGRCPRLTSLSDTQQFLLFYRGTIEDEVAEIVKQKLRCLSKVVRQREAWSDVLVDAKKADEHKHNTDSLTEDNPDDLTEPTDEEEE